MDITILIINWNSGDHLRNLLVSLAGLEGRVSGTLVLDNASTDHSAECLSAFPEVVFESLGKNIGFAAAVNHGFRKAGSRYVLLVNPDIYFENSLAAVSALYSVAERFPGAAIVTAPLNSFPADGGGEQDGFQVRPYPAVGNTIADLLFFDEISHGIRGIKGWKKEVQGISLGPGVTELSGQPAAALWLVRKSAWDEAGGMDERFYPAWYEDVDFCLGIRKLGWKILLTETEGRVFHKGGSSLESLGFSRFLGLYYRSLLRYWWKHYKLTYPLVFLACGIGFAARRIICAVRGSRVKSQ